MGYSGHIVATQGNLAVFEFLVTRAPRRAFSSLGLRIPGFTRFKRGLYRVAASVAAAEETLSENEFLRLLHFFLLSVMYFIHDRYVTDL